MKKQISVSVLTWCVWIAQTQMKCPLTPFDVVKMAPVVDECVLRVERGGQYAKNQF